MLSFSSGECAPWIVGPNEIISRPGFLPSNIPHSKPACIAFISASLLNNFLKTFLDVLSISESIFGFQPGYPSPALTSLPANLKIATTLSEIKSFALSIELRWLVPILTLSSITFIVARFVEVSTNPSKSGLIAITP